MIALHRFNVIGFLSLVVAATCASAHAEVVLRGGGIENAPIERVDLAGVRVQGSAARIIGWHEVKLVMGMHGGVSEAYMPIATDAWRARQRLLRGDNALAEPLVRKLFDEHYELGGDGPTAVVVSVGLAQCLIARGEHEAAVRPWVRTLQLDERNFQVNDALVRPWIDPQTSLVPSIAPVWFASERLHEVARAGQIEPWDADNPTITSAMLAWIAVYADAVQHGLSVSEEDLPDTSSVEPHPGVTLMRHMVAAQVGEQRLRKEARTQLEQGLASDKKSWRSAWRLAAVGRSYLQELDEASRTKGQLYLVELITKHAQAHPDLAAIAVAQLAREAARAGNTQAVNALRSRLKDMPRAASAAMWLDDQLTTPEQTTRAPDLGSTTTPQGKDN